MSDKQFRSFCTTNLAIETRGEGDKKTSTLRGYAAVFNSRSEVLGWYREILMPGAFAAPIAERQDVRALLNHDPNIVLGRTTNGTTRLSQDGTGLLSEIDLPDTQAARDLATSIARGDINQMSFAFSTRDYQWDVEDGEYVRVVRSVKRLYDVSPVTYPAYSATSVGLRAAAFGVSLDVANLLPALMRAEEGLHQADDSKILRDAIGDMQKLLDKILLAGESAKRSDATMTADEIGSRLAELQSDAVTVDALTKRLSEIRN